MQNLEPYNVLTREKLKSIIQGEFIIFRSDTTLLSLLYKIKISKFAFYIYKIMKLIFNIITFKLSYGTYR